MAKRPVLQIPITKEMRDEIEIAEVGENRTMADMGREALKEWMHRHGYEFTINIKPYRRKNSYAVSLAQFGRDEGFSRERARQIVNEEEATE